MSRARGYARTAERCEREISALGKSGELPIGDEGKRGATPHQG